MVQDTEFKVGVRLALFASQQSIFSIEQSQLCSCSDGFIADTIAIVVGHGGIYT